MRSRPNGRCQVATDTQPQLMLGRPEGVLDILANIEVGQLEPWLYLLPCRNVGLVLPDFIIYRGELRGADFLMCKFKIYKYGIEFKVEIVCGPTDISVGHIQAKGHEHVTVDRRICEDS